MTINDYPPALDPHAPRRERAVAALHRLAGLLGPGQVRWRYDPIVLWGGLDAAAHRRRFAGLCREIAGASAMCTVSFVAFYRKTRQAFARLAAEGGPPVVEPDVAARVELARALRDIAGEHGIAVHACCTPELVAAGLLPAACIDGEALQALRPDLAWRPRPAPSRPGCGCAAAVDIGVYGSCAFGCRYCYAADGAGATARRLAAADARDTLLCRPPALAGAPLDP